MGGLSQGCAGKRLRSERARASRYSSESNPPNVFERYQVGGSTRSGWLLARMRNCRAECCGRRRVTMCTHWKQVTDTVDANECTALNTKQPKKNACTRSDSVVVERTAAEHDSRGNKRPSVPSQAETENTAVGSNYA